MAISQERLAKLNEKFGLAVGFNPHGQPNFRWVRTEEMNRWVEQDKPGFGLSTNGLYVPHKQFVPRPWADAYGKCWILAKWRRYTEAEWQAMTGGSMPFPKHGEWEPVENIRLGPEYKEHAPDPDESSTADAIEAIKAHRERTYQDFMDESEKAHNKVVKSKMDAISDELDDMIPAFGNIPGSHNGTVEFMSGGKGN